MFTGIVQALGEVERLEPAGSGRRLVVDTGTLDLAGLSRGDSVAVNGVCVTATGIGTAGFEADLSPETLACTTLGSLEPGAPLNLERALRAGEAIGGHFVTGHVDGVGRIAAVERDGETARVAVEYPSALGRYLARKGSVCVDGVSLTVNDVAPGHFSVQIIPHTLEATLFGTYRPGTQVNLEVDLLARYLETLLDARR
jgi:riboflavin synthase